MGGAVGASAERNMKAWESIETPCENHCYRINEEGKIEKSDCVIPTNQNNANIYYDLKKLVEELVAQGKGEEEIANLSQVLVRAYDPCIFSGIIPHLP